MKDREVRSALHALALKLGYYLEPNTVKIYACGGSEESLMTVPSRLNDVYRRVHALYEHLGLEYSSEPLKHVVREKKK